ncbi:hypothetical protein QZH41_008517 [Actinostola sp. cb2023]|nr:hypothetical protein QZH41_008517 [Actinostola sp. cb2023]
MAAAAEARVKQELERSLEIIERDHLRPIQGRISRCAQECQDKVQDKVDTNTSQADIAIFQQQVEKCVGNCCASHMTIAQHMFDKMKKVISESAKAVK